MQASSEAVKMWRTESGRDWDILGPFTHLFLSIIGHVFRVI